MHRLVSVSLAVIGVIAVVSAAVGSLSYSPLALAVSATVGVGVAVAVNAGAAALARRSPHHESAVITGLIAFFLAWPSLSPLDLSVVAGLSALGVASKYLLVWRGRQLANPVVVAAVALGLAGVSSEIWWVASEPLFPAVLVFSLLILRRTRMMLPGLVFIVVALAGTVLGSVSGGAALPDALLGALVSTPILFLAGFMLTEPITLAPRTAQRVIVAVVTGVLFSAPLLLASVLHLPTSLGPLTLSPAFALLVGNLISFAFGPRRALRFTVAEVAEEAPAVWSVSLLPEQPTRFEPGQYLELSLPHRRSDSGGTRRVFSMTTAPGAVEVGLGVRVDEPASTFKRELRALQPGDQLSATRIGGDFVPPADPRQAVLYIAAGIGVTPFLSHLAAEQSAGVDRDRVLVYLLRDGGPIPFQDRLMAAGIRVIVVAPTVPDALPEGWSYAGASRLTADTLPALVPDVAHRHCFISGSPSAVGQLRHVVRRAGASHVTTDAFAGY
ncbi:FAD-dependent oxidoreductase [Mycetocola reblochoni]|uniref:Flavodoxin reductases (Ferredoxin-NADPH reductases) family 1 n=2 Tax=Mycetocola reblochoni TaxID=331618 RepID=A0A1R4K919_9MICO|nr:FAD-dependent oxidoreductase [Mycetocola reblochoni]RLP71154.1 FAD-dependent oxidoreductase [Mycetocola reblochoni]SJN40921.1 Flavodoxin reductases (ferredoxin-NADPH reductases) family 1 [Mycetocola reblochoni REB411]